MTRQRLVGLRYRQHHVLEADGERWVVDAESRLLSGGPETRILFTLELSSLGADWQAAIARARTLDEAVIDGIRARVKLLTVDLHFEPAEDGTASFAAVLDDPIPFPRSLDNPELVAALAEAGREAREWLIQADEIEMTERYWVFPLHYVGASGVVVDRVTNRAFTAGGSMDVATWIWAYEHRLLDEPSGDLVIERVHDADRAFQILRRFAEIRRADLATLPLVLQGCAVWHATRGLMDADGAFTWSVTPRAA